MMNKILLFALWCVSLGLSAQKTATYTGAPIPFAVEGGTCSCRWLAKLEGFPKKSYQGMDIWKNSLVSLQNTGLVTIYNFDGTNAERQCAFKLASSSEFNHTNVASFSRTFYEPQDKFPLLYVTRCHVEKENGMDKLVYVERLDPDKQQSQLVQTIWLKDDDRQLYGPSTQFVLDNQAQYLYTYGNTLGNKTAGNKHRIMKFKIPSLQDGKNGVVILTKKDALENYLIEDTYKKENFLPIIQGAMIRNGLLFLPMGFGKVDEPSYMYVWDLATHQMRNEIDLRTASFGELEDCAAYGDKMIIQTQGHLFELVF